ncbi:MAG TPA: exodeoxyribonuclease V subunit gamma [Pseudomonadales bacterium]|nr:exodeoxyribonuclease V subunit gamma [Pseudomonadales bacterium]
MLRIRQSNRLDRLADDLIEALMTPSGRHPLVSERVVVQSPGMATWLRHRLAERAGIAAAVDFPLPATFLWQVVRALVPEAQVQSPYEKRAMAWRLMTLLDPENPDFRDDPAQAPLLGYLEDDAPSGLKRFQLAQRVADLFDQYLIYRPDWMRRWRGARADDGDPIAAMEPWQPRLWRRLVAATGDGPDRAGLQERARRRLETEADAGACLDDVVPGRVAVFGLSAMPPEQLRLLLALAAHVDVDVYVFNPCRQFWSDIVSERYLARLVADETASGATPTHPYYDTGHPLLASLGRAGRDFVDLLLELGEQGEPEDAFETPAGDRLLQTLQRDILDLEGGGELQVVAADDDSLVFADCHGPLRELEALHDWLLARFEAAPELRPRDIIVMIPDIDRYAPCIDAVFGRSGAAGGRSTTDIPYGIADRGVRGEAPILGAVAALLRLPHGRFTVSELLGILETPAVLRAFRLDEQDLEQIAWWLEETGVRWGRDGAHWARFGFGAEATGAGDDGEDGATADAGPRANSWAFGIERLLLGYAMGDREALFRGVLPFGGVEGEAAESLGALLSFLQCMDRFAARLRGPHSAAVWAHHLSQLLRDCFECDPEEEHALTGVRELITELAELEAAAGVTEALTLDVVSAALEPVLRAPGGSHRFLSGQVTFCTLMPMRTVPFRIVALLGMNDGDYPRRETPLGFDLLARAPRKGDRARRLEDRYLFLEALLAAREHLYLSWSGRSPTDDRVQPPSVVVAELRDVLARSFRSADDRELLDALTRRHRLQPFSGAYGPGASSGGADGAGGGMVTYSELWALPADAPAAAPAAASGAVVLPPPEPEARLPLAALSACFTAPAEHFLATRLEVRLVAGESGIDDDEPFRLAGLQRYKVRSEALRALREPAQAAAWTLREQRSGRLPHGAAGGDALRDAAALATRYAERVGPLLRQTPETVAVDLALSDAFDEAPGVVQLVGEVRDCLPRLRLVLRTGRAGARDLMRLWIEHLALAAADRGRPSLLVDADGGRLLAPLAADAARAHLVALVQLRRRLLTAPAPLLVECSMDYAQRVRKGEAPQAALTKARGHWRVDYGDAVGEGERPAVARLWPVYPGDDPALAPVFAELSLEVWGPLLEALEALKDPALVALAEEAVADG